MGMITEMQNFIRIYRLPDMLSSEYCFAGGIQEAFTMVDWFNPVPAEMMDNFDAIKHREEIREFVRNKPYYQEGKKHLAITDYGDVFFIEVPLEEVEESKPVKKTVLCFQGEEIEFDNLPKQEGD